MIVCVACQCGSSDSLIRKKLRQYGYADFLRTPIHKGKDKSLSVLNAVPPHPEVQLLKTYIENHSRYAVILGVNEEQARWADVASSNPKEVIEAELVVQYFK